MAKPKSKPKPKPRAAKVKPKASKTAAKAKPKAKAKSKPVAKKVEKPARAKRPTEDTAATEAALAALAALEAPLANEYTTTADDAIAKLKGTAGLPESPLAPIDTATHAALVAANPVAKPALPRGGLPRAKSIPPTNAPLATIAPRAVFLPDRVIVDVEGDTFPRTKLDEHGRDESVLPPETLDAIRVKVSVAQRYLEANARDAYDAFLAGFELVPKPFENWNAAGWLLVAMGECALRAGDHARAFAAFKDAMHCPGTVGNPWVHLRLGQVRLELGDDKAIDDLAQAHKGGGATLFDGLDPKYLAAAESRKE